MQDIQDSPLVSICIPCYGQSHWLPDAVNSALAQTHKNIEVIVVNDGSLDNTDEVVNEWMNDERFRYIKKTNGGLSSARNAGIKEAKGKYILTLDADDMIMPAFIEKCLEADDDIASTAQQEFGDSNNLWDWQPEHPTHQMFLKDNQINCCSLQLREIWEEVGGYDERLKNGLEDWQYWLKATKSAYFVTVIRDPLFLYRKHGRSMISDVHDNFNEIHKDMMDKFYEYVQKM